MDGLQQVAERLGKLISQFLELDVTDESKTEALEDVLETRELNEFYDILQDAVES